MFFVSIFMLGNYTLLSYTIPTDLPSDIVATAAGIMTATGYMASGLAGVGMERIIDKWGYFGWFMSLLIATIIGSAFVFLGAIINKVKRIKDDRRNERITKNLKFFSFFRIGADTEIYVLKEDDIAIVKMSGIQDEYLRRNWDTNSE